MDKFYDYCFTLKFDGNDAPVLSDKMRYLIYGVEIGDSGYKHYQGYVYYKNKVRGITLKKDFGNEVHFERRRAPSIRQAVDYCKKDGEYVEYGEMPVQGKRSDLQATIMMSDKEIREAYPLWANTLIDNKNKLNEVKGYNENKRVIYITGPSGSGKTRKAYELVGDDFMLLDYSNGFLNGYEGGYHKAIYDEFRDDMPLKEFLKMTDKYRNRMNVKGGSIMFDVDLLVLTSIRNVGSLYPNVMTEDVLSQIMRRIEVINLVPPPRPPIKTDIE